MNDYHTVYMMCGENDKIRDIDNLVWRLKEKIPVPKYLFPSKEDKKRCMQFAGTIKEHHAKPLDVYFRNRGVLAVYTTTAEEPDHSLFESVIRTAVKEKLWYAYKSVCAEKRYFHTNDANHVFFNCGYVVCRNGIVDDYPSLKTLLCELEEDFLVPANITGTVTVPTGFLSIESVNAYTEREFGEKVVFEYVFDGKAADIRKEEVFSENAEIFTEYVVETGDCIYNSNTGMFVIPDVVSGEGHKDVPNGMYIHTGEYLYGLMYCRIDTAKMQRYKKEFGSLFKYAMSVIPAPATGVRDRMGFVSVYGKEDVTNFFVNIFKEEGFSGWTPEKEA